MGAVKHKHHPPFSSVSGGEPVDSDSHDTFAWPQDTSAHQGMPCNTLNHPIGLPLAQGVGDHFGNSQNPLSLEDDDEDENSDEGDNGEGEVNDNEG